ncbi:MAG: cytidine deaminase, partial [Spirochaetota bacterium]
GCNVENAAYGLTLCAERNAITTAVADGARRISVIAVSAGTTNHITPCGSCRQVISEFSDSSTRILCLNRDGDVRTFTVAELLPEGFVLDSGEK